MLEPLNVLTEIGNEEKSFIPLHKVNYVITNCYLFIFSVCTISSEFSLIELQPEIFLQKIKIQSHLTQLKTKKDNLTLPIYSYLTPI